MKFACLLVPAFSLTCELALQPGLQGRPVALANEAGTRVRERSEAAAARGVQPGMSLREAVAYCPLLSVLEPHPGRQAEAAALLWAAMTAVSPIVEEAAPGMVFADLAGLERLYPTSAALERAIHENAPASLQPRLGLAGQKFTAQVAAEAAAPGETQRVAEADAAAFLAPYSVDLLPCEEDLRSRLHLLGLDTLGALAQLPRQAVEAQFGRAGGRAWALAQGFDSAPVFPGRADAPLIETLEAQPPLLSQDAIQYGMKQLLGRILRRPAVQGRLVRALRLRAVAENDQAWEQRQILKQPSSDRDRLWSIVRPILSAATYPGPIVVLSVELEDLTAERGRQQELFRVAAQRRDRLEETLCQLKTRYQESPLKRLVEVEPWSRIPERRYALVDYDP